MINEIDLYKFCPNCKSGLVSEDMEGQKIKKCTVCEFTFWNNPKPSVSVVISQDGKVLMLKRPGMPFKNFWVLPGGYIGSKETPEKAAIRETKEETKLNVVIERLLGVYRSYDPRGIDIDVIFVVSHKGIISLSEEHKNWKFFIPQKLPEHIAYKHREAILDWLKQK